MSTAPSRRTSSKTKPTEANENELGNPAYPIPLPPPRSPLNSIQLPIQNSSNGLPSEPSSAKSDNPIKGTGATPKSAQSIPSRAVSRVSHGDGSFGSNIARERGCSSRFSGGIQDAKSLTAVQVPYFELKEDPSFWKDRNVQVLIRIRPISSMESALQGHRRCLVQESSQTLTWTGHPETRFTFDHVACETMSQEKLFRVVGLPMVENCMLGYNSCMFAYGQTGSGKTYTMMGEIHEMDKNLSEDLGMTPRIFEYLFTRIREEEERQSDEQLKYSCKCSFLEIYNEQITDLLEPSSTNLQLREDIKKGVYVENLKEYEVSSVKDVMELLLQGAANRKMAATHMNSESSRSHSVFTCVIESRWEKDSMTHLRFGRLNLVDLAGSERQKSSGAEGERLKEAANINRSLSTLGLVIMTLVDITNGKTRHVPYRDSRLTFLLQDSLGGNSKTTVIANVSPSICSASETLSTLKFAQRAKLIQNNAKVNEDASGDVMALQRQIQKLKDQLTTLIKHQNFPRSLCYPSSSLGQATFGDFYDDSNSLLGGNPAAFNDPSLLNSEIKQLEAALISALRREEMAEAAVKRLEAEIKHMNRLVHQREDDTQRAKTLLRFREEKLRRLELLADDLVSSDGYLMEENVALSQEIQLLRERIDRNPELTQFALENMRLLEQLRIFQNFYQQGERDTLLTEVSHLRNHLLKVLEGKFALVNREATKGDDDTMKDLDNCRRQLDACLENNAKLTREVDDLRCQLKQYLDFGQNTVLTVGYSSRDNYRLQETDKESSVELILVKEDSGDGIASSEHADRVQHINAYQGTQDIIMQFSYVQKELRDAKLLIKAMESQHTHLLADLDDLKQENKRYLELSRSIQTGTHLREQLELCCQLSEGHTNAVKCNYLDAEHITECGDTARLGLHATLERMHADLEEAKILNKQLRDDHASQLTCHHEMVHVQEQVEAETAKTILYLQEELAALRQEVDSKNASKLSSIEHSLFLRTRNEELDNRLCFLIQENVKLSELVAARDAEISALSYEWEKTIIDLTTFLIDGRRSLDDASEYIESVVESFPHRNVCINEHVERAMQVFIEKETLTADLQKRLEDAQEMGLEMKSKLNSLRGATLAITEVQQLENDENSKELFHLKKLLGEKVSMIQELESIVKCKEDHIIEAEKVANSSFEVIKKLYDMDPTESLDVGEIKLMILKLVDEQSLVRKIKQVRNCDPAKSEIRILSMDAQNKDVEVNIPKVKLSLSVEHDSVRTQEPGPEEYACALQEIRGQVEMAILRVSESNNDLCSFYAHTEKYLAALLSDINSTSSAVRMLFHDSINVVRSINKKFRELREVRTMVPSIMIESSPSGAHDFSKSLDRSTVMQIIVDEVAKANERLNYIKTGFDSLFCDCRKLAEQDQETYRRMNSHTINATDKFEQYVGNLIPNDALLKCLMEEAELAMSTLMEIHFQLSKLLDENDVAGCSSAQGSYSSELPAVRAGDMLLDIQCKHPTDKLATTELCQTLQTLEERMDEVDVGCSQTREFQQILQLKHNHAMQDAEERTKQATGLLMKFEEAQETVEEAELVLKALLKANEGAKHEKDWWKQVSAELLAEKTALIEEVQRLEASNFSKEKQYGNLQDQIHASLTEILGLTSSLRGSFQQIQRITGEELNVIYSGIFSFGQELLQSISTSRSWVEDMMSEVMEKGFALFVLYQCHGGALLEQIMHLNTCSDFAHYKHVESCSVIRNEDILDKNMMLEGMKDREVIYNHQQFNSSSLGETGEVLNACQIVQHTVDGPVVGTNIGKYERPELLSDQNCSQERAFKLERDNLDLTHDMELVKEMTGELAIYSDKFLEELTSKEDLSVFINFPAEKEKTEMGSTEGGSMQIDTLISSGVSLSSSMCEDNGLPSDISQGNIVGHLKSENGIHANMVGGVITDIEALLHDVQHLKTQFAQLISSQSATKDCSQLPPYHKNNMQESSSRPMYIQKGETGMLMLSYSHAKTVGGNQSIQALNKLENNLRYLISLFYPGLRAETEKRSSDSLLERSFEGICSIEVKVYILLEKFLRYGMDQADIESNNLLVKRELARKDNLIKGLLFDLRLLQESTSNVKGMKDEIKEMTAALSQVQNELAIKTAQIDKILAEQEVLEAQLAESEAALSSSRSEMEQAQKALIMLSDENTKLKLMLEDAYIKKTHTEELLEHKMKVIEGLQREILSIHSSVEGHIISSVEGIMDELRRVSNERDHLQAENVYLNDKLEMASALADENEAIAVEARQVAEASKIYAEQKEEEVKVLECSVEELEGTINILERKVNDMKEEVESHQLIRKGLELEVQALTQRMLTVENAAENLIAEYSNVEGEKCQIPRRLDDRIIELCEARKRIEDLEMEKSYTAEEIKQYREHISELVLHSEAQSSLYQEKFKALEAMVSEVKPDPATSNPSCSVVDKTEKISVRTRGSGSPFRCISSLVQQMNLEKDQELSAARCRIEELEVLAANRQKEICMLTARLAAVDSMTHDVIRDLMGVKLDMTNYANLIDQEQLQKLLEKAQEQIEETNSKEKEILKLKKQIDHLIEERESWVEERDQRRADILASQVLLERLQQRDQFITAQNEMLKMDKANLHQKIAELDEKVKFIVGSQSISDKIQQPIKIEENSSVKVGSEELSKRLAQSDKLLSHMRTSMKNKGS